jgi:hypothetical protein
VRFVVNGRKLFGAAHWPRRLAEPAQAGKNLICRRELGLASTVAAYSDIRRHITTTLLSGLPAESV